jgi:hypothetical protein
MLITFIPSFSANLITILANALEAAVYTIALAFTDFAKWIIPHAVKGLT